MDITLYISRFLYRIRYQLIFGTSIITALVIYFSQFLGKTYTVSTSIYTGITSQSGLSDESRPDWQSINNTFDNIVNLTKSKGSQEKVSLKLVAIDLIQGNPLEDNIYITAKNYKELLAITPKEIIKLVDKNSFEKTVANFNQYKEDDPRGFFYILFNGNNPFYSSDALSKISIVRMGNSDLINISYQSPDPGIALSTVKLTSEELRNSYSALRYKTVNDIVKYYEDELKRLRTQLTNLEDKLTQYNIENSVINYLEQTKAIAISFTDYENRYEETKRAYESATKILEELNQYMDIRTKLVSVNDDFIKTLEQISTINGKITEIEIFTSEDKQDADDDLKRYKEELKNAEQKIAVLTNQINSYKESKEGVAIDNLVNEWLQQTLIRAKAQADLKILDERKQEFKEQYQTYSPVGTQINRQEREIKLVEASYQEVLHALNMAKMKQKDLLLTSSNLNTITEPVFPLTSDKSKRMLLIIAAFLTSMIFIIGFNLVVELLDRTLRDAERTRRLTHLPILGAFTGNAQLRYRGFIKMCNRISASYLCNRLNQYLRKDKTLVINLLSIEPKEGKSFIAKYMKSQWEEQGLEVLYLVAGKDFPITASFITASEFNILYKIYKKPDILLLEYPAVQKESLPAILLEKSDVTILVANARRVWKYSDDEYVKYLKDIIKDVPLYIYLNNASREAVEDFVGQLPPVSSMRSIANRMMYMGLTAKDSAIKK
ncbi:GumC family protein [Parabacteroides chinchillae]